MSDGGPSLQRCHSNNLCKKFDSTGHWCRGSKKCISSSLTLGRSKLECFSTVASYFQEKVEPYSAPLLASLTNIRLAQ